MDETNQLRRLTYDTAELAEELAKELATDMAKLLLKIWRSYCYRSGARPNAG